MAYLQYLEIMFSLNVRELSKVIFLIVVMAIGLLTSALETALSLSDFPLSVKLNDYSGLFEHLIDRRKLRTTKEFYKNRLVLRIFHG